MLALSCFRWMTGLTSQLCDAIVWALLLGTGGGVLEGLGVAVGRPDSVEPVYKVSSEVVLTEEALETDPEMSSTVSEKGTIKTS